MNKKIFFLIIPIMVVILFIINLYLFKSNDQHSNVQETTSRGDSNMNDINVSIDGKYYTLVLEDNETTRKLTQLLPLDLNMKELNGNEKYYYLEDTLPTNSKNPSKIEKGDVMLYGNNCLVVFYKSFNTNYSYTELGHIDNLPDLGDSDINIIFSK